MQGSATLSYGELSGIGIAFALGLLVGIQRGWALRSEPAGSRFAGIRTFGLLGLAGGIAGALQARAAGAALVLLVAGAALVLMGYWRSTRRDGRKASISGTASLTGLITLAAGFLAGNGEFALSSAVAGVTLIILAMRNQLHHWLRHIDEHEMMAIARFALIALVILPLLPDTPYGPYGAWRPRQLWLVVVMVSGFSFAGYAAARLLGPSRGVLATSAAGALVSSTAVTASLAGKLRDGSGDFAICNAGVALASAVMFLRIMVLTGALARFALPTLATLAGPGMIVSLIATVAILRRRSGTPGATVEEVPVRNPFAIGPALALMGLTMVLTVIARWMLTLYGDAGLATVLAISGVVDVDSATITMGNLPPGTLDPKIAGLVLMPPFVLNSIFKSATLVSIAGWRQAWPGACAMLGSVAASGLALFFVL
ncbi:MgtC/SapB family protein [Novosphingobium sp.]|uniref:MgtC/SapB family protein n=1 Tax=Novosphingobium sp. TaxID=1874826 RepID=UPI0035B3843D